MQLGTDADDLVGILESLDIPVIFVPVIEKLMQEPTLLRRAATAPQLQSLLNDVHTNTWFTVAGTSRIARSRTGTRPGNPLADLLFALIIDPALDSIKHDLAEADLLLTAAPGSIRFGQLDDAPEPLANVA